jgi:hypothetical protein
MPIHRKCYSVAASIVAQNSSGALLPEPSKVVVNMDHRDDVTLYEALRGAHASARADTWQRTKALILPIFQIVFDTIKAAESFIMTKVRRR